MSKRGRKPKPTALKELNGNAGKRALNKKEPKPELGSPDIPAHLKGEALKEWNRLTAVLQKMKLLSKADRAHLTICCTAWADYVQACKTLETEGKVIISESGGMYQNPWVAIKNRSMEQVAKYYAEFGLTPSSRVNLKVEAPSGEEEMEQFLFGNAKVKVTTQQ